MSQPIKILAMESDEFFRIFLYDSILVHSSSEIHLTVTSSIEEALNILNQNLPGKPDIIFLGLSAPLKIDDTKTVALAGLDLLKTLREDENFKDVPIVIFSKYKERNLQKRAKKLGATKYVVKGNAMSRDLVDVVTSILK